MILDSKKNVTIEAAPLAPAVLSANQEEEQFSPSERAKSLLTLHQAMPKGLNFQLTGELALEYIGEILEHWIPDGRVEGSEYVALNPTRDDQEEGSFKINLSTGKWADFALEDSGGDLISLVAYVESLSQKDAALKILNYIANAESIGRVSYAKKFRKAINAKRPDIEPTMPIPASAGARPESFYGLGTPTASWTYRNLSGNVMFYIDRFATDKGGKTIRPLTYCVDAEGKGSWVQKAPAGSRPAYGLPKLAEYPDAPVLFTEGEKAADAAQRLFPNMVSATTMGGANAPDKTDLTPFAGRQVYIAPDNDDAGFGYAKKLRTLLSANDAQVVGVLDLRLFKPDGGELASGYDLADAEADGWNTERLQALGAAIWVSLPAQEPESGSLPPDSIKERALDRSADLDQKKDKPYIPNGSMMENMERFVSTTYGDAIAFTQNQFRSYSAGYWPALDKKVDIERKLCDFFGRFALPGSIAGMSSLMSSAYAMADEQFSEPKPLICLLNGTLNPIEGTLRPHSKDDYITNRFAVAWTDNATCPLWLQTLDEIFAPDHDKTEKIQLLQEYIGYCLVPMTHMHKFLWMVGSGGNGKSLVLSVITALVGRSNMNFAQLERIHEKFVRAELCGKLVNISSEMSAQSTVADGYLKQIVSGDVIEAERKNQPSFSFRPYCRMIGATNELPRLLDGSDGFFRRAIILRFNRRFTEAEMDRNREARLMSELPGILRWAVEGLRRLLDRGSFEIPASSTAEANRYRVDSDPIRQFVEECLVSSEERFHYLTPAKLHEHYQAWCRAYGYHAVAINKLSSKLSELAFKQMRTGGVRLWKVRYTAPATEDFGEPTPPSFTLLASKYSV